MLQLIDSFKEKTMQRYRYSVLTLLVGFSFFNQPAIAAAFQLYELGTPIVGTAGVGQAANLNDASTAYFNPAGMGFLPNTEYMLGSQLLLPYANFSKNSSNTISGDNGGTATVLTPGMSLFYAYNFSPCLKFGVSVTSPYGGSLNYDDGWVGRYNVQNAFFYTINMNPSFAYRFNQWFSLGVGVAVEYLSLQQTTAFPLEPLVDGQVNVKVDNWAPGFNIGLMFTPYQSTHIGLAYRSRITHNLHGNLTFLRMSETPNATTKMVMPNNFIASLAQDLSARFSLLAELGWSNWSTMKNNTLNVDNFSVTTPMNWSNTYRVGLGGQYKPSRCLILQAGASYDSSPTTSTKRLPVLPMDKQIRVGAGVIYSVIKSVQLGFSYEYWNLGSAHINNTTSNGVLSGLYSRNFANTFQASVNVEV